MKIVQIEDFFHPKAGYQVNILSKYFVNEGHDVYIICAEMKKIPGQLSNFFGVENLESKDQDYMDKYKAKIIRVPCIKYISGRAIYDNSIFRIVDNLKPDVLYVHGNDTMISIQYLLKYKKLNYPIITDSHMLAMASVNKFSKYFQEFYRCFIAPIIKKNNITVIRTQDDSYVEEKLGIPLKQCPWISYGSDTMLFHPDGNVRTKFRETNGISENDFVVVFAGKLVESKGAKLLANSFIKRIESDKKVVLLVIGNTYGDYGEKIESAFKQSENRIIRFPTQGYEDLAPFYQASDLAVFAKQCSLSFYDVQACGLPVVSEDNNINIDRCSHNNGRCFKSGDVEDFRRKIAFFANMSDSEFFEYSQNAIKFIKDGYDYKDKANEYLTYIEKTYNNFGGK